MRIIKDNQKKISLVKQRNIDVIKSKRLPQNRNAMQITMKRIQEGKRVSMVQEKLITNKEMKDKKNMEESIHTIIVIFRFNRRNVHISKSGINEYEIKNTTMIK